MLIINWILRQDQSGDEGSLSVLRSGAWAAPHASGWSHYWCWTGRHKLAARISLLLVFLLISLLFLPLCQSSIGNALFLCWGWNNEVDVFDVNAAAWTKPETLVTRPSLSEDAPGGQQRDGSDWVFIPRVGLRGPEATTPAPCWGTEATSVAGRWVCLSSFKHTCRRADVFGGCFNSASVAGCCSAGHVLLGPGDLGLDPTVRPLHRSRTCPCFRH